MVQAGFADSVGSVIVVFVQALAEFGGGVVNPVIVERTCLALRSVCTSGATVLAV